MNRHINSVAVFCGSRPGRDERYIELASAFGHALAEQGYSLVYGGGCAGNMGAVSKAFAEAGGRGLAVNVRMFGHQGVTPRGFEEIMTADMAERKKIMMERADAAVVLPGGWGTLDELGDWACEEDTKKHVNQHTVIKPLIILNAFHYYNGLMKQIRTFQREMLASEVSHRFLGEVKTVAQAFKLLTTLNMQGPVKTSVRFNGLVLPPQGTGKPANENGSALPQAALALS